MGGIVIKPKISIVIPVYNVENFIIKCMESVLNQEDFKNYEVIVVNDGTKDRSIELIKDLIDSHSNIFLVEQENAGLSEARNTGVRYATGEFISFLDSDDWIEPEMLSVMYEKALQTGSEIAVCKAKKVYAGNLTKSIDIMDGFDSEVVLNQEQVINFYLEHKRVTGYAWNKIYKSNLFKDHNIAFPKNKTYEDIPTTFELLWHSDRIVFINKHFYNYLQREGSITQNLNPKLWHLIENVQLIKKSLVRKKCFEQYQDRFNQLLSSQLFIVYIQLQKNRNSSHYSFLKLKLAQELKTIKFWNFLLSREVSVSAKLKHIVMRLSLDGLTNILLKLKSIKSRRKPA